MKKHSVKTAILLCSPLRDVLTEIGGNHTDHQHGCVLAGSVNLDVISAARPNGTNTVRIQSRNYPLDVIELDSLEIREKEFDKGDFSYKRCN